MLELLQFTPPDSRRRSQRPTSKPSPAWRITGGSGGDVDDVRLGKDIVKCQKAVEKVGKKLASGRLKILEKCVDALFECAQTDDG